MNRVNRRTEPALRHARRRGGYAMLLVMVIILTSTAFVALHQRHLNSALRIEQSRMRSETFRAGPVSVVAVACERLETGDPASPVSYRYDHSVDGLTTLYRVDYELVGTQWTITAEPDSAALLLPDLPASF